MRSRITAFLALVATVALVLAGCRDSRVAGDGPIKIMVGGLEKVIYLPARLAEQLGHFRAEGLDVQLLTEPAGASAGNALIAGEVQGAIGFYDHTIDVQTKGKCIQSVVQLADVPGEVEVVARRHAGTVTGPADFRGRKLGVTSSGSSTDFLTQYLAARAGVSSSDYTTVKAGAGPTFIAAIDNGGIDAGMTTDPTVAQLISSGKAEIMLDMRTEEGTRAALGGLYPASSLYMDCAFVARNKEIVQKLANAFVKTLRFIESSSAEEIANRMPADYANAGRNLYVKSINDTKGMFNGDGRMKEEGARNVLDVLALASPSVKGRKDQVDLARTYTNEFVDKVRP
ncbi:nitrate ABC transporter substrate-binding protein [Longimycelium tulufanense]|uniref:Nitrate ABC transporter substrate-binding protein n=1 Tax=Longimycelium tulufanense TaxID=907463 RepID=A0A8J3FTM0_9PSEU|nr:ABC transporter substrate-binding protein [Longimycelium tulufanense]GGM50510.1 nitrate ABC transporter substrate-binding protein [Longimycelium tulufanense]